jgi:ABC-type Fe3+ transport system permease subunit
VVGSWCFLCLVTAVISLTLVVLAYDEVWSSVLYLARVWKRERDPRLLWNTFWGRPSEAAHEVAFDMVRRKP